MYQLTWKNKNLYQDQEKIYFPKFDSKFPSIKKVLPLYWEEHCVECAIPSCYSSCKLYKKRKDLKCSRLAYGIFPNDHVSGLFQFGADITFERWAKLESYWPKSPRMVQTKLVNLENNIIQFVENFALNLSSIFHFFDKKRRISRLSGSLIEKWTIFRINSSSKDDNPDGLFAQFYYPESEERELQLEITGDNPVFRTNIKVKHGWNEVFIEYSKINISFKGIGRIRLWPSNDQPIRLIFTWLDLVSFNELLPAKKVKCVCWDLDNTLWDGVIGDDGKDSVVLNEEIVSTIKEFDKRGILQSIVSKNDYDLAWEKICSLNLKDYFLYPAIHWNPKSESLKKIAKELNININSFAVIDDSMWERNEINNSLPNVRTYDPADILKIISNDEFNHPITEETKNRRKLYLTEKSRKAILTDWGSDTVGFLKNCKMEMTIKHPSSQDELRCIELLQRSNQFNLSGKDYSATSYFDLTDSADQECICVSLKDKFGNYGIVMVMVMKHYKSFTSIIDFAMSCRIAKKLAEDAFFKWCTQYTKLLGKENLKICLRVTGKNNPLIESLQALDLNMTTESNNDEIEFKIKLNQKIDNSDIIKVISNI